MGTVGRPAGPLWVRRPISADITWSPFFQPSLKRGLSFRYQVTLFEGCRYSGMRSALRCDVRVRSMSQDESCGGLRFDSKVASRFQARLARCGCRFRRDRHADSPDLSVSLPCRTSPRNTQAHSDRCERRAQTKTNRKLGSGVTQSAGRVGDCHAVLPSSIDVDK